MKIKRKPLFIILAIILVVGGWLLFKGDSKNKKQNMQTATVELGNIEESVTAQGKLEPKEYVDVGAQVSGQLKKVHFEIGDVVKNGDLLAEIDPKVYESRVEADEARLKTLNAQLQQQQAQSVLAKQQFDRNQRLIKAQAISQDELQQSESGYKVAIGGVNSIRAQIEEAESTLKGDQANLSYTKIYAPMDGTVTSQTTREGQTINANQTAPVILQIADLDIMTVRAQVAEADVMRLKPDMEVYFTTLGSLERKWKGTVRQILPSPETINDVVLYNALIDAENKDRQLLTGMSTQIFFVLGQANNVPLVPVAALGKKTGDNQYVVKVLEGKDVVEKPVTIGLMNRTLAEVKSGLAAGEKVVLPAAAPAKAAGQGGGMRGMPRI